MEDAKAQFCMAQKIEMWPCEDLFPYGQNARIHSAEQIEQITESIKEFGFVNPILVDREQGIIAGQGRLEAAKTLGLTEVPVIFLDHLSDEQKRAYVIIDNKLAMNSEWDECELNNEIDLILSDGFDLEITGFTEAELDLLECV